MGFDLSRPTVLVKSFAHLNQDFLLASLEERGKLCKWLRDKTRSGSHGLDPGSQGKPLNSWCISFETECTLVCVYRMKYIPPWDGLQSTGTEGVGHFFVLSNWTISSKAVHETRLRFWAYSGIITCRINVVRFLITTIFIASDLI